PTLAATRSSRGEQVAQHCRHHCCRQCCHHHLPNGHGRLPSAASECQDTCAGPEGPAHEIDSTMRSLQMAITTRSTAVIVHGKRIPPRESRSQPVSEVNPVT